MSSLKPLILHSHRGGPNPWKVSIVLEELGVPYETTFVEKFKEEPYITLNPNGRLPALEDPNTGIAIAESGAILQYLVENYDSSNKLHHTSPKEHYQELQWLHFQMSGQGPYFGQAYWFHNHHPEKIQSAIDRYDNEMKRVASVIDGFLKKKGTHYLIGDKVSYADLAFVMWNTAFGILIPEFDFKKEYPHFAAWNQRLLERPAVVKVMDDKRKALAGAKH